MIQNLFVALAALALIASQVGSAEAKSKKKRAYGGTYAKSYGYRSKDDSIGGYYEHRLEAVRFGSQRWWKIYEEQRGGTRP